MPDLYYKSFPFIFASSGIVARLVDDTTDPKQFLNLDNCEELAENSFSQRLGSTILNSKTGAVGDPVYPLSASVKTIFKLGGLGGQFWRYAGTEDGKLWRIAGTAPGQFTQIASGMSGNPFWAIAYTGNYSGQPYAFIADLNGMLKDNGTLAAPQQMGIFQPQYPVQAQSQAPLQVPLDDYSGSATDYSYSGISGGTIGGNVNTTLASSVAAGTNSVTVADPTQIGLFQLLYIDTGANEERVLVLQVTPTGFIADFTKPHASGAQVTNQSLSVSVPASTTATVSKFFGGKPIPESETVWGNQADYIGLYLFVSDPTQVQSITLKFDCGDGSFQSDYFYKVVAQGPLQTLLSTGTNSQDPTTALTDAVLSESLDLYGPDGIGELNTGLNNWTPLLFQLSDFSGSGKAQFGDPVFNWANVNGYQVEIVTNDGTSVTVQLSSLILFGGAGPDSLGGVAYDYRVTFFNAVDLTESNPSTPMSNQNPPNATNWVYPRRQPVLLSINISSFGPGGSYFDSQITHLYIYRRGGTLGDNWRWIGQLQIDISAGGIVKFTDTAPDSLIGGSDTLSLTNDVPVTSTLPVPVDTTLVGSLSVSGPGQVLSITPASMANISVRQLVTIGDPTNIANNFETVIVLQVGTLSFTAFVQNDHAAGEPVQATASIGQPVSLMAEAYGQFWFAGDPQNPNNLYWSSQANPQYVSSAAYKPVSTPDDIITSVVSIKGNLYVSTIKGGWWAVAPGSNDNASPTIYPTACKYGSVSPTGVVVTEQGIYYQAIDGQRFFAGGPSEYMTQEVEFLFQGVGETPIVEADQTKLNQSVMSFWGNMVFNSYIGPDDKRHRLIWHTIYKRFRNDDFDAQSMYFEPDTKLLLVGDSNGLIHIDRQNLAYDQTNNSGVVAAGPILINLESSYLNQGAPANQKNYNNLQLDIDTAGQDVTVTLLFNDGEESLSLGTVSTSGRQKFNLQIENGDGYQAYKVSLQLSGGFDERIFIYQAALEALTLPMTRKAVDTYDMNCGGAESKFCRDFFAQYSATAPITVNVYYDDNPTPGFTFTMPQAGGIRNPLRQRLPAISFRTIRVVAASTGDFMWWQDTCLWVKVQCQGRGYEKVLIVEN